jgi:hypothetical protein
LVDPKPAVTVLKTPSPQAPAAPAAPFYTGRDTVRYTDVQFEDTTSLAALSQTFASLLEQETIFTEAGRKFVGTRLVGLRLLGANITVVHSNATESHRLPHFLQQQTRQLGLLNHEDVDLITADLAQCVANQSALIYQVFPAVTGSRNFGASVFDHFARENYVYAACGNADRIELALVTGIYVANDRPTAQPLPGFDARKVLKRYLQWSFTHSLAGTCSTAIPEGRISLNLA